jgi:hypothetical protein
MDKIIKHIGDNKTQRPEILCKGERTLTDVKVLIK